MKLALVTETFPPEINGVAMTLSHLAEGLCERGHNVSVVRPLQPKEPAPTAPRPYSEICCPGIPIPGYSTMRIGLPARGRLLAAWRADRPDLVHVATEGPLGWSALSAARKLGIPLTSSFHTNFHSYSRHYGFAFLTRPALAYLRVFHNRTHLTLSPTVELNQQLAADGFKNMRLLSRGVNTRLFTPARRDPRLRAAWGAGPDDLVVIHVSRVAAEKNFPLLLQTYEHIRSDNFSAKFVITSDGPLRSKLERRYPWVHFTGALPREELARHYASADYFIYPSLTETFGNVVLEAMASGLPVLAFHYAAAARYIRNGVNGLTVPCDDTEKFIATSRDCASRRIQRSMFGEAARATAETIHWDKVIDGFETDLAAVISCPALLKKP